MYKTYTFYLIFTLGGEVVARKRKPTDMRQNMVVVPMRVELPYAWFEKMAQRIELRLPAPMLEGAYVQVDAPLEPDIDYDLEDI